MNAPRDAALVSVDLMSGGDYRDSLRKYKPKVFVDGREVASVADEPALEPGINALAFTYDYALRTELEPIALATQASRNRVVARLLHVNESAGDLLNKLEAVRVMCQCRCLPAERRVDAKRRPTDPETAVERLSKLFTKYDLAGLPLSYRVVMARGNSR